MAEVVLDANASTEPIKSQVDQTQTQPHQNRTEAIDTDAQALVIHSLRSQIQDLFSQVTQLNSKLVQSYDRVSDLEDNLHATSSNLRASSLKIAQLELERTQHLSALNTGLLVEKSHVTAELTRLMERATDEAARRGQAESARADIEKDLDDLSANLFDQANTMVAEARFKQAGSERKVTEAESALRVAEEAVSVMQQQMQTLKSEKEEAEKQVERVRMTMGKGKWVEHEECQPENFGCPTTGLRLLNSHVPYQEFLLFVSHLRTIRPASPNVPAMSTLLPLPFLARLLTEDSEPTLRLDLAPSLNWLSRRSVLAAIHNGQLSIEPLSTSSLLSNDASTGSISISGITGGSSGTGTVSCSLCGTSIFSVQAKTRSRKPPIHPAIMNRAATAVGGSWSTSLFRKTAALNSTDVSPITTTSIITTNGTPDSPTSPTHSHSSDDSSDPTISSRIPQQIFIFRLAPTSSSTATSSVASIVTRSSYIQPGSSRSSTPTPPSVHPTTSQTPKAPGHSSGGSQSWLPSLSSSSHPRNSKPSSPAHTHSQSFSAASSPSLSITTSSIPSSSTSSTIYPLCTSRWCLMRLRTTCILWAFIRAGVVEKVWEEKPTRVALEGGKEKESLISGAMSRGTGVSSSSTRPSTPTSVPAPTPSRASGQEKAAPPPIPPRRRGLWGMASALGAKANWGSSTKPSAGEENNSQKTVPPPPPIHSDEAATTNDHPFHSSDKHPAPKPITTEPEGLKGLAASNDGAMPIVEALVPSTTTSGPPPLPKRNQGRKLNVTTNGMTPTASSPPSPPLIGRNSEEKTVDVGGQKDNQQEAVTNGSLGGSTSHNTAPEVAVPEIRRRSLSPRLVRLPDSRPGSSLGFSPSTPTGAAPPLPRRAAARAGRPLSAAGPPTDTTRFVNTGAHATEVPRAKNAGEPVTTIEADNGNEGTEAKDSDETKVEGEGGGQDQGEDKQNEDIQSGEYKASDKSGGEPALDPPRATSTVSIAPKHPEPDSGAAADESVEATDHLPFDSSQAVEKKDEVTVRPEAPAETLDSKDGRDEKQEGFVGDSTWEERTWKHIVKLREDMFWARVGCLR